MGILTDYLRAPRTEAVVQAMKEELKQAMFEMGLLDVELPDDALNDRYPFGKGLDALERIDASGMYDDVLLYELIAVIKRVPVSRDLVKATLVWPAHEAPDPAELTGEDP